jgi:hypothetical protein
MGDSPCTASSLSSSFSSGITNSSSVADGLAADAAPNGEPGTTIGVEGIAAGDPTLGTGELGARGDPDLATVAAAAPDAPM